MRVLHVVATGERRGAEVFASDLVTWLSSAGATQVVVVLRGKQRPAVRYDAPIELLESNSRTVPVLRIEAETLARLRKSILSWRPDVVQAHGGESFKYATCAVWPRRTPVVYRKIGAAPRWIIRGPRNIAHRLLVRRAARVVAVADALRRETIELFGVSPRRVVTIPNAVDARRLEPVRGGEATRAGLGIPSQSYVILSLGALSWEKDPFAHIAITEKILREDPRAFHILAGDGPMRTGVERDIRRLGLEGRMLVLGSRPDVADLLAASDVVLFASRSDGMEGMPASLIEAGMMGLPVVAYSIAGVPEIVIDGRTGLLVREGDREALTDRIGYLLANDEIRLSMGERARQHCRSTFEIASVGPRYLDVYRRVMNTS